MNQIKLVMEPVMKRLADMPSYSEMIKNKKMEEDLKNDEIKRQNQFAIERYQQLQPNDIVTFEMSFQLNLTGISGFKDKPYATTFVMRFVTILRESSYDTLEEEKNKKIDINKNDRNTKEGEDKNDAEEEEEEEEKRMKKKEEKNDNKSKEKKKKETFK